MRRSLATGFTVTAAALLAVGLSGGMPAVPAPAGAPAAKPAAKERKIIIHAPKGVLSYDDATKTYTVTDATIDLPDSDSSLSATKIEFNNEERWAKATGKPRMWDPQNEITADVIRADFKVKRVEPTGSVRMVARPKPAKSEESKKLRDKIKEPVVVHCDTMQYYYKTKQGTATGNLKITQKDSKGDRTATGARLTYDGNAETVVLDENVQVNNTRGEGFQCTRVTFNLKEGAEGFKVEGLHDATFFVQEDDDQPAKNP